MTGLAFVAGILMGLAIASALAAAFIWYAIWEEKCHKSTMQERDY
jgi:hypothetical protein